MSELIKTPKDRIPKAWIELSRERELPSSVLRFIVRVGKATAGKDPLRHEAICECVQSVALVRREWIGGTHTYFYVRA